MISRYCTTQMASIWAENSRLEKWVAVEMAALGGWEKIGSLPQGTHSRLMKKIDVLNYEQLLSSMQRHEEKSKHDVLAFLAALGEQLGEDSQYIHFGLTSSDVVDTAFALSLKAAGEQMLQRVLILQKSLWHCAKKYQHVLCLGRTHGQAAETTTFGLKILGYVAELQRNQQRLQAAIDEISHGKISGAVGNYGNIDPRVEAYALNFLGLKAEAVSTQIVPRDRHAVFFSTLAVLAGFVERLAVEIRHLMRTEVAEAFEPFAQTQQGSSAMPHKRNPILSENLCGLARVIRNYASTAFENQALWHERDISHSSAERIIAPDATSLLDFALHRLNFIIEGLIVNEKQMALNIEKTRGLIFSETLLLELVKQGAAKKDAYLWIQQAAQRSVANETEFYAELLAEKNIGNFLPATHLNAIFDKEQSMQHINHIFDRVASMCGY